MKGFCVMQFPLQTCQAPNSLRRCTLRARGSSCKGDRRCLSSPESLFLYRWTDDIKGGGEGGGSCGDGMEKTVHSVQVEAMNLTITT